MKTLIIILAFFAVVAATSAIWINHFALTTLENNICGLSMKCYMKRSIGRN